MTYERLLSPLGAQGLRVLAIDLRGHGLTTLPARPDAAAASWDGYRDDLLALLRLLAAQDGLPRVLSGHSMGGATCLLATLQWPADLGEQRPLVLFDPVVAPPALPGENGGPSPLVAGALRRKNHFDSLETALASYVGRGAFKTWPAEVVRDYLTDGLFLGDDQAWHLRCAPEWEAYNFSHPFRPVNAPIAGLGIPITVLRAAEGSTCHWSDWPPQADVRTVPDSTHFIPMERPELAREVLLAAVARQRDPAVAR
jgi:pimeloyl-ACP methyl ester carboxylesterase